MGTFVGLLISSIVLGYIGLYLDSNIFHSSSSFFGFIFFFLPSMALLSRINENVGSLYRKSEKEEKENMNKKDK